ncbi:MAG: hypothetical protein Q4F79_05620 [Eubacteriales bacterium]|nr:hypothetical protein [Eubacteriales bacterium]
MKAIKGNRVYTIDETQQAGYVSRGFDIVNDDGTVIQNGRGKTVPYDQYAAVVAERDALEAQVKKPPKKPKDEPEADK